MIYECPNCHVPQAAGRTSCHHCGADFDGPVPADALVPEAVAAGDAASPPTDALPQPPPLQEAAPSYQTPPDLPPYQPPPAYAPPSGYTQTAYTQTAYTPAPRSSGFNLPKALLIAIPIVLAIVLGAVFFANSLNQGGETAPPPPATSAPLPPDSASPSTPTSSPLLLPGNSSTASGGSAPDANPTTTWLVGRWESKSTDFYVFNENGSGVRGGISGKQAKESFQWTLNQKQILLYTDAAAPEKLAFSQGSDDDTMFLRDAGGHYVQYTRAKTSS